eukprot:2362139-Rhodomonas_salina.1
MGSTWAGGGSCASACALLSAESGQGKPDQGVCVPTAPFVTSRAGANPSATHRSGTNSVSILFS